MSDVTEVPAAPEAPAAPDAPPSTEPADSGLAALPESWQKEIHSLRQEAASNRTAAKPYKEAFDGLDDNDRDAFLGLVQLYKKDPFAAGEWMRDQAQALTPAERGEIAEQTGAAATDAPLTRSEFDRLMAEREQQTGIANATSEIQREAKSLGYDPEGPEYLLLIQAMNQLGTTDVAKGHEAVEKFRQGWIDKYLAGKEKAADTSPRAPADGSAPAGQPHDIKTLAEAHSAAKEFLANL